MAIKSDRWQEAAIQEIVRLLQPNEAVRAVALFGTAAQPHPDVWSDIDLLLVVDEAAKEQFHPAMGWLEPRRHPWRAAVTASIAAGIALKLPDLVLKGDVDLPAAAVEAVAAFTGYVLLGGLLGLRQRLQTPESLGAAGAEG